MRQEYRKVVEHNELEVIVVPGDERIRAMPFSEKLKIALEYADWEGAAYKARDMAVLFAACSAVLGVLVLTPLDEVIIVLAPVLELIGYGGAAIEFAKAVYKLADFVDRVRNAQSEGALAEAGSIFAEAAAAVGITMLFAFLGRLSKLTKEQFRNRKQVTVNSAERYGHSSAKAYKTEAQIREYIKNLKVDSAQQTKLMSELAHDPKNLKRFLNRYGDEAASLIKRHGYPPKYWKGRPSYKEGQVETVWENAKKDPAKTFFEKDGIKYIRDRKGIVVWNKDIPRNGQWDMGHIVEDINKPNIYAREYDKYLSGEITEDTFLEWYRSAKNYEPQLPRYNRGLKGKK